MRKFHEETTLVQASELRTHLDQILAQVPAGRVILEKHHKPVAVLVDPKKYEEMEEVLETLSDILFALEAREREKKVRLSDYISLEAVKKRHAKP